MEDSLMHCTETPGQKSTSNLLDHLFLTTPHSAIVSGATGCGKTVFILNLSEKQYRHRYVL